MDLSEEQEVYGIDAPKGEHILVCLSSSPSNAKIILTASRMAQAFHGTFTALYVETSNSDKMNASDKERMRRHIRLAEQSGAVISTVYGNDVSYQIAEFARISHVTKIVIGRSNINRSHFWSRTSLTEELIKIAPSVDIHIIPDSSVSHKYYEFKKGILLHMQPSGKDLLITLLVLAGTTGIGMIFWSLGFTEANIITVYILGVLLTSLFTKTHFCSVIGALASVLLFNFLFTEPRLTFHAYEQGYPFTFAIMLTAALITGTLANKLKSHAKQSAQSAFRTKILFETNQLLQKAEDEHDMIRITASQLMKLLDRDITACPKIGGTLDHFYLFQADSGRPKEIVLPSREREAAQWTLENQQRAGAGANIFPDVSNLYLPIHINRKIYGVIGIKVDPEPLDSFENSVLLSILGECALAVENICNSREKEAAALLAQKEQLRANLLRAISHDLRTPLTSISGNASNLLSNYEQLDKETVFQMFTDIYDDSQWLISLVENLLSVTRIDEGRLNFHKTTELMEEVIEEALRHISRKRTEHEITTEFRNEMLLVSIDAKLILQVLINIIDNAIKYTPPGSLIKLVVQKKENMAVVSVADNGPGIPDEIKPRVFEMFFTGNSKIIDSRRSLGLGLALCKSIINIHGGELTLEDNCPQGCIFTFTLPLGEVNINE